uniref:RNase H type-1 domain-containing protein n=1 Tax=Nicotiana tabacum TaxID=4097 RepID=A0A1S4D2M3_TOBAC|nr:PREDICTED: uncharacterized protein LOC107825207 [Nicotiana tabacum]
MAGWKTKYLNMAGRTVLAKTSLNNISSHVMQYINLPTKITNQIDRIQRNFLWGTTLKRKKLHLIKWEVVTKTKAEGGLGLQKASTKNKASLTNLAWRTYKNTNSLWARVLIHKHCNMSRPVRAFRHPKHLKSPTWKGILKGWEICSKASRWVVHKENMVSFLNDTWIANQPAIRQMIRGSLTQNDLEAKENIVHIFFEFPNVVHFWNDILSKSTGNSSNNHPVFNRWWQSTWNTLKNVLFNNYICWDNLIPFCLWNIWLTRNINVFNNKKEHINANNTISKATEYLMLTKNDSTKVTHQIMLKWEPPSRGSYKLNTDGAAKGNLGIGGSGRIFRNHNGDWILGYMDNIPQTTNTRAEVKALIRGLQLAEQNHLVPLEINTDSAETINMLLNGSLIFDPLICECRSIIQRMGSVVVRHTYREQNRVVDALAKEAAKEMFLNKSMTLSVPPMFVNDVFWAYILGTELVRSFVDCNLNTIMLNLTTMGSL